MVNEMPRISIRPDGAVVFKDSKSTRTITADTIEDVDSAGLKTITRLTGQGVTSILAAAPAMQPGSAPDVEAWLKGHAADLEKLLGEMLTQKGSPEELKNYRAWEDTKSLSITKLIALRLRYAHILATNGASS